MFRIDIENIYKMAASFEEEAAPPTLPAGAIPKEYKDKDYSPIVEPNTTRFLFQENLTVGMIKDLMLKFHQIFDLSRGAISVLRSMNKNTILSPISGIDTYIEPMEQELKDIISVVGKKYN